MFSITSVFGRVACRRASSRRAVNALVGGTMVRVFWAFIAFNIYSLFLISAFAENTPYLFDAKLVSEMLAAGEIFDIKDLGWKDHYIWRLFSGVFVTAVVAFLAGAIARSKGGKIAAIANLPSIFVWAGTFYLMASGKVDVEGRTGFLVVSLIAIPLTTWIAFHAGNVGAETQASDFTEGTVLGIRPLHWAWIVFPLYLYSVGIVYVGAKFLALQFLTWRDMSMVAAFISLLALAPLFAWVAPLKMVHKVLSGHSLGDKPPVVKALANMGILIGGIVVAIAVQFACFWVLQKIISWWY